jgi:hypothetical protein
MQLRIFRATARPGPAEEGLFSSGVHVQSLRCRPAFRRTSPHLKDQLDDLEGTFWEREQLKTFRFPTSLKCAAASGASRPDTRVTHGPADATGDYGLWEMLGDAATDVSDGGRLGGGVSEGLCFD